MRFGNIIGFMIAAVCLGGLSSATAAGGTIKGTLDLGKGPFVVYVEKAGTTKFPAMAPNPQMNQRGNTYLPHILPVVVGSKVEFHSEDPELHNVYAKAVANSNVLFNIGIPPKTPAQTKTFAQEGIVKLTCNVHKEMLAWILVLQNPYFTLLEKGATDFQLTDIPAGNYNLKVWGEKLDEADLKKLRPVTVTAGGVANLSIAAGAGS
jgi:plastocyanin